MTGLEILLAVAGLVVTVLVVAGMILITPRGEVGVYAEETDPQGSNLSRAGLRPNEKHDPGPNSATSRAR